jgi:hypothetical protein
MLFLHIYNSTLLLFLLVLQFHLVVLTLQSLLLLLFHHLAHLRRFELAPACALTLSQAFLLIELKADIGNSLIALVGFFVEWRIGR